MDDAKENRKYSLQLALQGFKALYTQAVTEDRTEDAVFYKTLALKLASHEQEAEMQEILKGFE